MVYPTAATKLSQEQVDNVIDTERSVGELLDVCEQGSTSASKEEGDEEEPIVSFSKNQRWPEEGEPVCVVCGRFGEYICDQTDQDVCSLECKAKHLTLVHREKRYLEPEASSISANMSAAKYKTPTAVQMQVLPAGMMGRDVMAAAPTGSGKTAAFLLPVVVNVFRAVSGAVGGRDPRWTRPLALILAPTRELCMQTVTKSGLLFLTRDASLLNLKVEQN
ncbi:DDX59 [Branchiostoma lanceolatum]|uniref:DDX59 protein n=1 Tax=Branchiostoma lanceolatum TaxID=7740 RepID=A0A8J9ZJI6_BRALA|nr:DDX59 [Branchiostoma lanceolatum]